MVAPATAMGVDRPLIAGATNSYPKLFEHCREGKMYQTCSELQLFYCIAHIREKLYIHRGFWNE